jgi:hypothetical protein
MNRESVFYTKSKTQIYYDLQKYILPMFARSIYVCGINVSPEVVGGFLPAPLWKHTLTQILEAGTYLSGPRLQNGESAIQDDFGPSEEQQNCSTRVQVKVRHGPRDINSCTLSCSFPWASTEKP